MTPALGDTRRITVLEPDVDAARDRWLKKGWKVTRRRKLKDTTPPSVQLTLTYARPITSS